LRLQNKLCLEKNNTRITSKGNNMPKNIIGDHPFSDGNKQTAVSVCGMFLAHNNKTSNAPPQDLENFAVEVAVEHLSITTIARWLKAHTN
jgi:death-on-curing protein